VSGTSTKSSRLAKVLWIVLTLVALIAAAMWTDRWRSMAGGAAVQSADATARAGDVKRDADGRLLYFDGQRWAAKPLPPQDAPF
jgi:hypothetical protein